jgi:hypothetical protein
MGVLFAGSADPRTTTICDRRREDFDRHAPTSWSRSSRADGHATSPARHWGRGYTVIRRAFGGRSRRSERRVANGLDIQLRTISELVLDRDPLLIERIGRHRAPHKSAVLPLYPQQRARITHQPDVRRNRPAGILRRQAPPRVYATATSRADCSISRPGAGVATSPRSAPRWPARRCVEACPRSSVFRTARAQRPVCERPRTRGSERRTGDPEAFAHERQVSTRAGHWRDTIFCPRRSRCTAEETRLA